MSALRDAASASGQPHQGFPANQAVSRLRVRELLREWLACHSPLPASRSDPTDRVGTGGTARAHDRIRGALIHLQLRANDAVRDAHGGVRFGDIRAKSADKHTFAASVEKSDESCRGADHIHDNAHVSGNSQGSGGKESTLIFMRKRSGFSSILKSDAHRAMPEPRAFSSLRGRPPQCRDERRQ